MQKTWQQVALAYERWSGRGLEEDAFKESVWSDSLKSAKSLGERMTFSKRVTQKSKNLAKTLYQENSDILKNGKINNFEV